MSDHERPCGCLFKGYEVVSQCVYHTGRQRLIESLQRENEELREKLSAVERQKHFYCIWEGCDQEVMYCEGHAHELVNPLGMEISPEAFHRQSLPAITPEMRERIERKLADMQAESPLPIGGELVDLLRDLLGEQG